MKWIGNVFKENKTFYRLKKHTTNPPSSFSGTCGGTGSGSNAKRYYNQKTAPFVWKGGSQSQCSVHKLPSCPSPWETKAANTVDYSMHGYL